MAEENENDSGNVSYGHWGIGANRGTPLSFDLDANEIQVHIDLGNRHADNIHRFVSIDQIQNYSFPAVDASASRPLPIESNISFDDNNSINDFIAPSDSEYLGSSESSPSSLNSRTSNSPSISSTSRSSIVSLQDEEAKIDDDIENGHWGPNAPRPAINTNYGVDGDDSLDDFIATSESEFKSSTELSMSSSSSSCSSNVDSCSSASISKLSKSSSVDSRSSSSNLRSSIIAEDQTNVQETAMNPSQITPRVLSTRSQQTPEIYGIDRVINEEICEESTSGYASSSSSNTSTSPTVSETLGLPSRLLSSRQRRAPIRYGDFLQLHEPSLPDDCSHLNKRHKSDRK